MEIRQHEAGRQPRWLRHWEFVRSWPCSCPGDKGLPAESKVALQYLLQVGGGIEQAVDVHTGSMGQALGVAPRSAERALERLERLGLISTLLKRRGEWRVFLNDPRIAAKVRLVPVASSDQRELFPVESELQPEEGNAPGAVLPMNSGGSATGAVSCAETGQSADVVSHPPIANLASNKEVAAESADVVSHPPIQQVNKHLDTCIRHKKESASAEALRISALLCMRTEKSADVTVSPPAPERRPSNNSSEQGLAPSADVTPHPPKDEDLTFQRLRLTLPREQLGAWDRIQQQIANDRLRRQTQSEKGPAPLGPLVGALVRAQPTPVEKAAKAEQVAKLIAETVQDRGMYPGVVRRIAWHVVDGDLSLKQLEDIFDRMRQYFRRAGGQGGFTGRPGSYFVRAVQGELEKVGIDWKPRVNKKCPPNDPPRPIGEDIPCP